METVSGPMTWEVAGLWSFISKQGPEFAPCIVAMLLAVWNGRQSSRHSALSVIALKVAIKLQPVKEVMRLVSAK